MRATSVKVGDVVVIGHESSRTMTVTKVKPLDIEWRGDNVVPQADTAYDVIGVLEDGETMRTITVQTDDEIEVI